MSHILAIDQGTTSTRAIVFNADLSPVASSQQEFPQHYPNPGWVEHDPADLWRTTRETCLDAVEKAGLTAEAIAAIGITNQRETTLIWDRQTGEPIAPAIVWQDRRTAAACARLRDGGHEPEITRRTGLLLDPYFSGTKIQWLLDHVKDARERAERGELCFGTVDSFLIWKLTNCQVHATDATNASRTMLFNIRDGQWDEELCALLNVPMSLLPEVRDCDGDFGTTDILGGTTPILAVAGDQHAATIGQACFEPGMMKSTYGTGCFALLNTGDKIVESRNRLLTTLAYQFGGKPTYALEGSIFIAGAAVQWLRDGLGIISSAGETQNMARAADPNQKVTLVPAFTGLGAPYWNAECRGAIFGLTRNTGPDELARAALESVGHQTADLIAAMRADGGDDLGNVLRVDGGMTESDWAMQFLSDILNAPVDRPCVLETTALGVAWVAGRRAGLCAEAAQFANDWSLDRRFEPEMDETSRRKSRATWARAIEGTLGY